MTVESASVSIGVVSAMGAAMLQQNVQVPGASIIVPAISAVIGAAMSYAMLKTTVAQMQRDLRDIRQNMGEIYDLLRENSKAVAHMQGRMEERAHSH